MSEQGKDLDYRLRVHLKDYAAAIEAADEIASLRAQLAESRLQTEHWRKIARDDGDRADTVEAQLASARKLMRNCVDDYYVASGKVIVDGQDGYGSLRAMRVFLSDD